jgi:hypothetical protein
VRRARIAENQAKIKELSLKRLAKELIPEDIQPKKKKKNTRQSNDHDMDFSTDEQHKPSGQLPVRRNPKRNRTIVNYAEDENEQPFEIEVEPEQDGGEEQEETEAKEMERDDDEDEDNEQEGEAVEENFQENKEDKEMEDEAGEKEDRVSEHEDGGESEASEEAGSVKHEKSNEGEIEFIKRKKEHEGEWWYEVAYKNEKFMRWLQSRDLDSVVPQMLAEFEAKWEQRQCQREKRQQERVNQAIEKMRQKEEAKKNRDTLEVEVEYERLKDEETAAGRKYKAWRCWEQALENVALRRATRNECL